MLAVAEPLLGRNIHPTVITAGYYSALQKVCEYCERVARKVDVQNREEFNSVIRSCIGTKFINRFGPGMVDLAIDAVMTVSRMQVAIYPPRRNINLPARFVLVSQTFAGRQT
jgi:T-complex protein 1 subunit gamma